MNKSKAFFGVIFTSIIVLGLVSPSAKSYDFIKSRTLINLEKEKKDFEQKGKEVPKGLIKKIEFETEYSKKHSQEKARLEKE